MSLNTQKAHLFVERGLRVFVSYTGPSRDLIPGPIRSSQCHWHRRKFLHHSVVARLPPYFLSSIPRLSRRMQSTLGCIRSISLVELPLRQLSRKVGALVELSCCLSRINYISFANMWPRKQ